MELKYCRYKLITKRPLNRLGDKVKEGLLLLSGDKFMDYMPWEQFGDLSIDDFLVALKSEVPEFVKDTLNLEIDFKQDFKFLNHSMNEYADWSDTMKLKFSGKYQDFVEKLPLREDKKLRIDFNNGLTPNDWDHFELNFLEDDCIEYVEDPYPGFDRFLPKVAADFNQSISNKQIKIYKPLRENMPSNAKLIFSNSMGHPIGLILTYFHLIKCSYLKDVCHGILMPDFYENYPQLFIESNGRFKLDTIKASEIFSNADKLDWVKL